MACIKCQTAKREREQRERTKNGHSIFHICFLRYYADPLNLLVMFHLDIKTGLRFISLNPPNCINVR